MQVVYLIVLVLLVLAIFFTVTGLSVYAGRKRRNWFIIERMPRILRQSELVLNEHEIRGVTGNKLRVDQVFKSKSGSLIIVDTKTRKRHVTYSADKVQLKKYADALQSNYNQKVARFAYIRTVVLVNSGAERSVKYIKLGLS